MCSQIVNAIGLFLDLVSACLLYFFGIASTIRPEGASFLRLAQDDQQMAKQYDRNLIINKFALLLLMIGFFLQLISAF